MGSHRVRHNWATFTFTFMKSNVLALFTIAKAWKQSKCPSTDEHIKRCVCVYIYTYTHTHNGILCVYIYTHNGILLNFKIEWNNANCSNMDGTKSYHTRWNNWDKERQILYEIIYLWNLKTSTNELTYKTNRFTDIESKLMVTKVAG